MGVPGPLDWGVLCKFVGNNRWQAAGPCCDDLAGLTLPTGFTIIACIRKAVASTLMRLRRYLHAFNLAFIVRCSYSDRSLDRSI